MSERDARYCLKLLRDEMPDGIGKVLAEEPDVVKVLRWLTDEWPGIPILAHRVQREFGIRLTEDGWEYVEEETG
jgi:hypothetical protein